MDRRLINQSEMLKNAHAVMINTEQIGELTLSALDVQRQQMEHMSINLIKTNDNVGQAVRLLRVIKRNELKIKFIMLSVIFLLFLSIIIVIYVKTKNGSSATPPTNGNVTLGYP